MMRMEQRGGWWRKFLSHDWITAISKAEYLPQELHKQLRQRVEDYDRLVGAGHDRFGDGD
jgi:hypothetical protein